MSTSTERTAFLELGLVDEHLARLEGLLVVRRKLLEPRRDDELAVLDRRLRAHLAGLRAQRAEAVRIALVRLHSPVPFEACAAAVALLDLEPAQVRAEDGTWRLRRAVAELLTEVYVPEANAANDASTLGATSPVLNLPRMRLLPFDKPSGTPSAMSVPSASRPVAPSSFGDTAPAQKLPRPRVLPFAGAPPEPSAAMPLPTSLAETSFSLSLPTRSELPFANGAAASPAGPVPRTLAEPNAGQPPERDALTGTSLALNLPRPAELPFGRRTGSTVAAGVLATPLAAPPAPERGQRFAETSLAAQMPRGPALPFEARRAAGPASVHSGEEPTAALQKTSLTSDVPRVAFLPLAPDEEFVARATPAKQEPNAGLREALTGTSISLDLPRPGALPFAEARATTPWPFISLTEHAALCAELAFAPARAADIFERHGLTAESKNALDQHYRDAVGASSELLLSWNRTYASRYDELARGGSPGRST